ncbi:SEC14-like protein 2 [Seminavis robusta]|uniref:SEC14-like protein 2 n=1 Tax=Seminavis robusta TaxID=568900 RepID=A0A9N8DRT2_9STRA|nr:SEC14-like protein 2 [Seminavis robusta]|eukprot:Sro234_g094540.1 SEC14-like protein 2 (768) ;mRNA; r:68708-71114
MTSKSGKKRASKKRPKKGEMEGGGVKEQRPSIQSSSSVTRTSSSTTTTTTTTTTSSTSGNKWETLTQWTDDSVAMVADWWNMKEDQVEKLWQLRDRLTDVTHWKNQPNEVVRYLRDAKFNVKDAEAKFRRMIQWRIDEKVDDIIHDYQPPHPLMEEYLPTTVLAATDKEGDPIWVERVGAADSWGLFKRFGQHDLIRYAVYIREVCIRGKWAEDFQQKSGGKPPMRATAIIDLGGMSFDHCRPALLPLLKEGLKIVQEYYVGFGKKIIVIRVSKLFPMVWKVAQHFCGENMKNMMVFATADNYLEVLSEYVELEKLPPCLFEGGEGHGGVAMPNSLDGGKVPSWEELDRMWEKRQQKQKQAALLPPKEIKTSDVLSVQTSSLMSDEEAPFSQRSGTTVTDLLSPTSSAFSYARDRNALQPEDWSDANFREAMRVWECTPKEEAQLRELQQRVADVDHWKNRPSILLAYLREHKHNLKVAEDCFRKTIQWREENGIDHLIETYRPPMLLLKYFSNTILRPDCCDKDGDPIYIERPGPTDSWSLYQRFGAKAMCEYLTWIREEAGRGRYQKEYERLHGHEIHRITVVVDLVGLSTRHMKPGLLPLFREVVNVAQAHYCGIAKRVFVIRAPRIFKVIWKIVQHFLEDRMKKLLIFASEGDYLDVMSEYIELENLPPCIYEGGHGEGGIGLPKRLDGGLVPPKSKHDYDLATREDIDPGLVDGKFSDGMDGSVASVSAKVARLGGGFFELSDDDDARTVLSVCSLASQRET